MISTTGFVILSSEEFLCLSGFILLSNGNEHFLIYFQTFDLG